MTNGTRQTIIHALWQYIKAHKLQDAEERDFINCDTNLQQVRPRGKGQVYHLRPCFRLDFRMHTHPFLRFTEQIKQIDSTY